MSADTALAKTRDGINYDIHLFTYILVKFDEQASFHEFLMLIESENLQGERPATRSFCTRLVSKSRNEYTLKLI